MVEQGLPFCHRQPRRKQTHCQKSDSTHGVSTGLATPRPCPMALGMVLGGLIAGRQREERHAMQAGEDNMISQSLGMC